MSTPCSTSSWAMRVSLWLGRGARGMRSSLGPRWPRRSYPAPHSLLPLQASPMTTVMTWLSGSSPSKMALCTLTLPSSSTPATV